MAFANIGNGQKPDTVSQSIAGSVAGEHYMVQLNVTGDSKIAQLNPGVFPLRANLPERWHLNFSSQWQSPFAKNYLSEAAGKIGGDKAQGVVDATSAVAGIPTRLKSQSVQVWESSSPMSFNLDLTFNAREDSDLEIRKRHKALLQLAAPSQKGEMLIQPGPIIADKVINKDNSRNISLQIGKYIFLDNVVITSVSSDVVTLCDVRGIPISMTINIEVQSFYSCFTVEDIEAMFSKAG